MKLISVLVGLLLVGGLVSGSESVKPGIMVTLNSQFFKTAINNLITYMSSLKMKNNICEYEDGTTRQFKHITPLFTVQMNCSNFQFQ